jgi:chromosome partitioning protein
MVPAEGLGWPDRPPAATWHPVVPPGLHRGHAEPEGPELSQGPRAFSGQAPDAAGLGWPGDERREMRTNIGVAADSAATERQPAPVAAPSASPPGGGVANGAHIRTGIGSPGIKQPGVKQAVQRALSAAVSRETAPAPDAGPAGPVAHAPARNAGENAGKNTRKYTGRTVVEDAMHGGTAAQGRSDVGSVVIPEVLQNPQETPIGRAAAAAVGVRGAGNDRSWPRPASCRIMTIANQKGGVGKTTTAVNLAAGLAQHGSRVLVIDLDPQGNASTALDVDHHVGALSVYNMLVEDRPLADIVQPVEALPGLYCAPATIDLAGAEIELVPLVARESRLSRAVAAYDSSGLDYILIDCPPSLGLLTLNALVAAREVLIPIQCEYYALEGLEQLLRTVDLVKGHLNPVLQVTTILLTMYDGRTRLASQVADDVRSHFGEVVLQSIIPRSVRVSEAPSYGQSVITYDPGSSGSVAYVEAARELSIRSPKMAG